jgi:hypothetical protein
MTLSVLPGKDEYQPQCNYTEKGDKKIKNQDTERFSRSAVQKLLDGDLIKPLRSIPVFYLIGKKRPGRLST